MEAEIQKILSFSEAIREWSVVPSSVQNLHEITLLKSSEEIAVLKLKVIYSLAKCQSNYFSVMELQL